MIEELNTGKPNLPGLQAMRGHRRFRRPTSRTVSVIFKKLAHVSAAVAFDHGHAANLLQQTSHFFWLRRPKSHLTA